MAMDGGFAEAKLWIGILLTATGVDANGSLFPLAYAVVNAENDENWFWFLHHLRDVLQTQTTHLLPENPDSESLVILSDRQKGLIESVDRLFPKSPHGFCLRHLQDNMHKKFKHPDLKSLLWKAARAKSKVDFDRCLDDMRALDPNCVSWLLETTSPEHWADLYFKGKRYSHLTSNIAEAFNAKLLAAREMPILAMLEEIRHQVMGWFSSRRHSEDLTFGGVVSGVAAQIQELINKRARRYRYMASTDEIFEIRSNETLAEYLVNLEAQTCSCRIWQTAVHLLII